MTRASIDLLLDILYPRRCAGCGAPGRSFCADCRMRLGVLTPPGCARCGRPLECNVDRCADCPPSSLMWARAAFAYEGPARRALMSLKFGSVRSVADALVPWMQQAAAGELTAAGTRSAGAAITWVPLSPGRRRERGFDQAEALARGLATRCRLPARGLLRRVRETPPQARRGADERRRAIRGAFRVIEDPPPTTVLVDDVLTTGATADACARALRDAGSSAVGLVTAARSLAGALPARCYTRDVWILS